MSRSDDIQNGEMGKLKGCYHSWEFRKLALLSIWAEALKARISSYFDYDPPSSCLSGFPDATSCSALHNYWMFLACDTIICAALISSVGSFILQPVFALWLVHLSLTLSTLLQPTLSRITLASYHPHLYHRLIPHPSYQHKPWPCRQSHWLGLLHFPNLKSNPSPRQVRQVRRSRTCRYLFLFVLILHRQI